MSKLIVEVCKIDKVERHSNADSLDIFTVKGWEIIANRKDDGNGNFIPRYNVGDKIVFCPPDSILPKELSDKLDITKYLTPVYFPPKNECGVYIGGRVRAIRLRGQPSYGCMFSLEEDLPEGTDVAEKYGITKWEPPSECQEGDAEKPSNVFLKYTSIENIGNYPNIFTEGEEVVFTEKAHGMNVRLGKISDMNDVGEKTYIYAAGSHGVQRKPPVEGEPTPRFWEPMTENMKKLLDHLCNDENNVIVYGEIIGNGIQDMTYGFKERSFRAFDISVNGNYLGYNEKKNLFEQFGIEMVPVLYKGPFSKAIVKEYTSGPTTICSPEQAGKFKGREGIVITPVIERETFRFGRTILKSISADYLARKNGTDSH